MARLTDRQTDGRKMVENFMRRMKRDKDNQTNNYTFNKT